MPRNVRFRLAKDVNEVLEPVVSPSTGKSPRSAPVCGVAKPLPDGAMVTPIPANVRRTVRTSLLGCLQHHDPGRLRVQQIDRLVTDPHVGPVLE